MLVYFCQRRRTRKISDSYLFAHKASLYFYQTNWNVGCLNWLKVRIDHDEGAGSRKSIRSWGGKSDVDGGLWLNWKINRFDVAHNSLNWLHFHILRIAIILIGKGFAKYYMDINSLRLIPFSILLIHQFLLIFKNSAHIFMFKTCTVAGKKSEPCEQITGRSHENQHILWDLLHQ